jgi:hypothetical protein
MGACVETSLNVCKFGEGELKKKTLLKTGQFFSYKARRSHPHLKKENDSALATYEGEKRSR